MCGVAGILRRGELNENVAHDRLTGAVGSMRHRGPDASATWIRAKDGIAFGHCRLAIIDLSAEANQPMHDGAGRWTVTYNGELYNYRELRNELRAVCDFRTGSDTEVLLAALAQWGAAAAVRRLNGMFAFAAWDRLTATLHLARDRAGEKPLYYALQSGGLVFASELRALQYLCDGSLAVDEDGIRYYRRFGYIPAPHSVFRDVRKLPPAHLLTIRAEELSGLPEPVRYWSPAGGERRESLPIEKSVDELAALLGDAVAIRMQADVPYGALLSGGIDSSLIVALMQRLATRRTQTFTIGFENAAYDESLHAKRVAAHLGTEHHTLIVTAHDLAESAPAMPRIFDEPFADASQLPTFLVAALARRHVTMALSGDGGDETFLGYHRYVRMQDYWRRLERVPLRARRWLAKAIERANARYRHVASEIRLRRLARLAALLRADSPVAAYAAFVSLNPDQIAAGTMLSRLAANVRDCPTDIDWFQAFDWCYYLPDDVLVKVDRATMAVSLESRAPLLDHRVAEFAWAIPDSFKLRAGQGKWILREVLNRYVPRHLVDRPKQGFGPPLGDWLRGTLRDWAGDLLASDPGDFSDEPRRRQFQSIWQKHQAGEADFSAYLWNELMLIGWALEQRAHAGGMPSLSAIPANGV